MRFKTLKHKTLEGLFGVVDSTIAPSEKGAYEICQTTTPHLQPATATMDAMIQYWEKHHEVGVIEQLQDYDLVEVDIQFIQKTSL